MSIAASSTPTASAVIRPRHAGMLRTGLVIAIVISVLNAIPAVAEIGLDGSPWDILVIFLAIFCPVVAVATIVLSVLAWHGRRRPAGAVAVLQLVAIIWLVPPFVLVFVDPIPPASLIAAGVTIALEVVAAWLILRGRSAV